MSFKKCLFKNKTYSILRPNEPFVAPTRIAAKPTKSYTMRERIVASPKIAATKLKLKSPTRPQLIPPITTRTRAIQSKVERFLICPHLLPFSDYYAKPTVVCTTNKSIFCNFWKILTKLFFFRFRIFSIFLIFRLLDFVLLFNLEDFHQIYGNNNHDGRDEHGINEFSFHSVS